MSTPVFKKNEKDSGGAMPPSEMGNRYTKKIGDHPKKGSRSGKIWNNGEKKGFFFNSGLRF